MKRIFSAIETFLVQLLCSHNYKFVKWVGSITSQLTDPWSSETGWKDHRLREVCCQKCEKVKREKVLVGGAVYGGYPWKKYKAAYKS